MISFDRAAFWYVWQHHGAKATGVAVSGGQVATIGWDDKLRIADATDGGLIGTVSY